MAISRFNILEDLEISPINFRILLESFIWLIFLSNTFLSIKNKNVLLKISIFGEKVILCVKSLADSMNNPIDLVYHKSSNFLKKK